MSDSFYKQPEPARAAMRRSTQTSQILIIATLGLALSACGSSDTSGPGGSAGNKGHSRTSKTLPASQRAPADMVAAVAMAKSGPPVELKFELDHRPEVGEPVDMYLAVVPGAPNLQQVSAQFQAGEGLELIGGDEPTSVEKPAEGAPIRHTLRIIAKRDGIFIINASISVDSGQGAQVRSFSIPVIAGHGLAELATKPESSESSAATPSASGPKNP
jgi:hypothetical protein